MDVTLTLSPNGLRWGAYCRKGGVDPMFDSPGEALQALADEVRGYEEAEG